MRLIDADELLKAVDKERRFLIARGQEGTEHILVHNFRDLIDNAPTVEPSHNIVALPHEVFEKMADIMVNIINKIDWNEAIEAYKSRPHGYWLNKQKDGWNCSECGEWSRSTDDFCKGCGADMRGGSNEVADDKHL